MIRVAIPPAAAREICKRQFMTNFPSVARASKPFLKLTPTPEQTLKQSSFKHARGPKQAEQLNQTGNKARPAGLVAGPYIGTVVAMEILV